MLGLCACSTSCVHWKLICCLCVCHSLKAHLCILPLFLDLLWRELFFDLSFFIGLLLSRAGPYLIVGFSLFSPFFASSVLAGYKLVVLRLCACFTSCVHWKLICCSCVCHSLKAHLCILPLFLDLLWRELFFDLSFFIGLLLSRAEPYLIVGFSPFSPFFASFVVLLPFLPYYSTIPVVVLFDSCLLGLFGLTAYSSINDSMWSLDLYSCYFGLS